jgi:hypothetical protein
MCAFSGKGTGTAAAINETFSATTTFTGIQVIALSGDVNATFSPEQAANSNNVKTATPTFFASVPPPSTDEFLFGALTNGGTEPSWNAIAGFSALGSLSLGSGATGFVPVVYFGIPSANPVNGSFSSGTADWGTLGIEVTP